MSDKSKARSRTSSDEKPGPDQPLPFEVVNSATEPPVREGEPSVHGEPAMAAGEAAAGMVERLVPAEPTEAEALLGHFVTEARLADLWARLDSAQGRIHQEIDNIDLAEGLFDSIQQARSALLDGKGKYETAARLMASVEYRLLLNQRVERYSRSHGVPLLVYEGTWALVLGLASALLSPRMPGNGGIAVNAMIWGGLGGVVGALHALWRHISRDQDFDKQFSLWYVTSPIMGVILGSFIYLVVLAGFLTLNSGDNTGLNSGLLVYVLAWLAGFQQNVAYTLARRILRVIVGETEAESPATPAAEGN